jgi:hypothetical protein
MRRLVKSHVPFGTEASAEDRAGLIAIAERLCGLPVVGAELCRGGGNNRVYRIRTSAATYALKCYAKTDHENRDRLGHEFEGLLFLKASGIGQMLPAALAVDRASQCALYDWVDGVEVTQHTVEDVDSVLDLLRTLHVARTLAGAASLPNATEAVFSASELLRQIDVRLQRLRRSGADEPELQAFLAEELEPELQIRMSRLVKSTLATELLITQRTLSPSDLGFHNALRRSDGSITFIDFEYFGWDDPVKVSADFLWHPGMELTAIERTRFTDGVKRLYRDDPEFVVRLNALFPFYGIRWVLIVLNEFLPQAWERRSYAGRGRDWDSAKRAQLSKARAITTRIRALGDGESFL